MPGESTFSAQITNLVGGATIDQEFCDDAAMEGAKEIINQLPVNLKAKCSTVTPLNNSSTTMDLDGVGDILHVTRLSANSGGYHVPCREIPSQYGGLATDPTDVNYYGTASDPVFWIASNTSDTGTLFVKPDPEVTQIAYVHHISYPSIDVSASTVEIANFPDEATYLVVLYAAIRQLYAFQASMSASFNSDITTALTAVNTELDETQAVCDLINTQVDSAIVELAESAANVDSAVDTAVAAMATAAGRVNTAVALANAEFDKSDALLTLGEADSESAVNTALGLLKTEVDDARTICDDVGSSADSAITALGNMATEIALANAEVDGVTTTLAQALALTDSGSTDIKTALTGMQTAVAKFRADASDPALFGDESTYHTSNSAMTNVKTHLDRAISYVNGDFPEADSDLVQYLKDINDQVTAEDTELAASFMQAAQTTMNAMQADLQIAQTYITEWNTMVQTLVSEVNAFASEAGSRYGWINAKAVAWQGKLSAAQGYMGTAGGYANQASGFNSTAQTYASEAQTRISVANGYVAEINTRLAQAGAKGQESQSRLAAGQAYLQEASASVQEVQAYGSEVGSRLAQVGGQTGVAQGYISAASGFASEVQAKIAISNGYIAEANARLQQDTAKYGWYSDQHAKLSAEYARGLAVLKGG